jgi:phosphonate transport system ATP-binding protein
MQEPDLLLIDEPTASLDPRTARSVMRLLTELCAEPRLAAIVNIHDVALAQMFLPRIVGPNSGKIVYEGPAAGLDAAVLTAIYGDEDWTNTVVAEDPDGRALGSGRPPPLALVERAAGAIQ